MTAFPIFKRLSTAGYGLYPGTKKEPDLEVEFQSGLTLVLGANGLGKTTLVNLLYRMCTGPYELPKPVLEGGGELRGKRLQASKLTGNRRMEFADRVHDGAVRATAALDFELGEAIVSTERSLRNLELIRLECNGVEQEPQEDSFQKLICERAEVNAFVDWILLLRHLTFYFEDRRSLVWDPSAQKQILHLLFLSRRVSSEVRESERDVRRLDSNMRNMQWTISSQETELATSEDALSVEGDTKKQFVKLKREQERDQAKLNELNETIVEMTLARERAQLEAVKAEGGHESAARNLERHQFTAIEHAFPSSSDTAKYLISQLISDNECLACGSKSPRAASTLKGRLSAHRCVLCNSSVATKKPKAASPRTIEKARKDLERAAAQLDGADARRHEAERELDGQMDAIEVLRSKVAERSVQIEAVASQLPPGDVDVDEQRTELAAMRAQLETMKRDLSNRRQRLARLVQRTSQSIVDHADDVRAAFESYAQDFLLEDCQLIWSPQKEQVGETGARIPFPAFKLEIGGSDFDSPVRRDGPGQVSESQREFIDLSFRMALMQVAGVRSRGSVVIDAPESSLDAVFVKRAAEVLVRFADEPENRVVITSNLIEGNLIPKLIKLGGIKSESSDRVVDLLKVAAPTAATRLLGSDYAEVRKDLFKRAKASR
jgi:energy-coupling factor transporter ATP-binding protein EcfA2